MAENFVVAVHIEKMRLTAACVLDLEVMFRKWLS